MSPPCLRANINANRDDVITRSTKFCNPARLLQRKSGRCGAPIGVFGGLELEEGHVKNACAKYNARPNHTFLNLMGNSSEDRHIQKAIKILAKIRQSVDELLALVPNLMDINSIEEIDPEERGETALTLVVRICGNPSVNLAALPSLISVNTRDRENFDWYKNTYPRISQKASFLMKRHLLAHWDVADVAPASTVSADSGERIKIAFSKIADFANEYLDGLDGDKFEERVEDDGLDAPVCKIIISRPYFEPDAWKENEIFPIVVTQNLGEIPRHISQRVEEIQRSFIFGNWMAVVALSRCLLEFALIEKADTLRIKVYAEGKALPRRLCSLIEDAKKTFPELAKSMDRIREQGNHIMHRASGATNVTHLPLRKDAAEMCFKDIATIIGTLYSE